MRGIMESYIEKKRRDMKKILVILNPCAGKKKGSKKLSDIVKILNNADYETTIYTTKARGDGIEATKRYAGQVDAIACVGGDGTLNEAITGVLESGANTPLGYIPAGSTNDFATSLQLPKKLLDSANLIAENKPIGIDIGRFQDRYFTYIASFGAFTRASYATSQKVKNVLGHAAYLLAGVKEIANLKKWHCRFELDEGETIEGDYIFGAVSNSTSVAGVLKLDPKAIDLHDGKFELLLIKYPKNPVQFSECVRAMLRNDYTSSMLVFRKTSGVSITADAKMDWTLDGEKADGVEKIRIENLHDAVQLIL